MADVRQLRPARRTCTCHPPGSPGHGPRVHRHAANLWVSPLVVTWAPYEERFSWAKPLHVVALAATLLANRGNIPTNGDTIEDGAP